MSLDVSLIIDGSITREGTGVFVRDNGANRELSIEEVRELYPDSNIAVTDSETDEVFEGNLTHNLVPMAQEAGLYFPVWRPHEKAIMLAKDNIDYLREGLHRLKSDPDKYKAFNPSNGWGDYEGLVTFVSEYLDKCYEYPEAKIEVWA